MKREFPVNQTNKKAFAYNKQSRKGKSKEKNPNIFLGLESDISAQYKEGFPAAVGRGTAAPKYRTQSSKGSLGSSAKIKIKKRTKQKSFCAVFSKLLQNSAVIKASILANLIAFFRLLGFPMASWKKAPYYSGRFRRGITPQFHNFDLI